MQKYSFIGLTLALGILAIFSSVLAFAETSTTNFSLSNLYIYPSQVDINKEILISFLVTNNGAETGDYQAKLMINSKSMETQKVTVNGHASEKVIFKTAQSKPGSYQVSIGDLKGNFTVIDENSNLLKPLNWTLMGVLIAVSVIVLLIIIWLLTSRRLPF